MQFSRVIITIAASLAMALAQGPGNGGQANQNGTGICQSQLDMTQLTEIQGTVTAVNIGAGIQYPSIEVDGQLIRLGPVWFLLEADFEIGIGQEVTVLAVPSAVDPALHAVWIRNESTGVEIELRAATGSGNWARRALRGGQQQQASTGVQTSGACGLVSTTTVTGTVIEVTSGVGIRQPNVVIEVDGELYTIKIGPSRILLEAGFEIVAGDQLTVTYGTTVCTGELVALTLSIDGVEVQLRDETGRPVW
jgi:hypothetical protein